jgi:hypothetical protein
MFLGFLSEMAQRLWLQATARAVFTFAFEEAAPQTKGIIIIRSNTTALEQQALLLRLSAPHQGGQTPSAA